MGFPSCVMCHSKYGELNKYLWHSCSTKKHRAATSGARLLNCFGLYNGVPIG
jgi:hypothetical protein